MVRRQVDQILLRLLFEQTYRPWAADLHRFALSVRISSSQSVVMVLNNPGHSSPGDQAGGQVVLSSCLS